MPKEENRKKDRSKNNTNNAKLPQKKGHSMKKNSSAKSDYLGTRRHELGTVPKSKPKKSSSRKTEDMRISAKSKCIWTKGHGIARVPRTIRYKGDGGELQH